MNYILKMFLRSFHKKKTPVFLATSTRSASRQNDNRKNVQDSETPISTSTETTPDEFGHVQGKLR